MFSYLPVDFKLVRNLTFDTRTMRRKPVRKRMYPSKKKPKEIQVSCEDGFVAVVEKNLLERREVSMFQLPFLTTARNPGNSNRRTPSSANPSRTAISKGLGSPSTTVRRG